MQARTKRRQAAISLANAAIDALNSLYSGTPSEKGRASWPPRASRLSELPPRTAAVMRYIFACMADFVDSRKHCPPPSCAAATDYPPDMYAGAAKQGVAQLDAAKISLPAQGGTFDVSRWVGEDIGAFLQAEPAAMEEEWLGELLAAGFPPQKPPPVEQYAPTLARMAQATMVEFGASGTEHPLVPFAVWKLVGEIQRLVIDGRPTNGFFRAPPYVSTEGDCLSRMQVPPGFTLEAAKCDLSDFFHACSVPPAVRRFFRLPAVDAAALRRLGVDVPDAAIDAQGRTWPQLTTVPMGWRAAPGCAQAGHEAVLYGGLGEGSAAARELEPVLDPAARWSSQHAPDLDSEHDRAPHALVIDDLLLFRLAKQPASLRAEGREAGPTPADAGHREAASAGEFGAILGRYADVGLTAKPSKLKPYAPAQVLLGYQLEDNVLRQESDRYWAVVADVEDLSRRGWARPREIESLVGRITHVMLLHRPSLAIFSAVYAFSAKNGHRAARLWASALRELRQAVALLPLVRSDLGRPVSPLVVQSDACESGGAVVYTTEVPHDDLRRECRRPHRRQPPAGAEDRWSVQQDLAAAFDAPTDPASWHVAVRRSFPAGGHINEKELAAVVDGVRWAARGPRGRGCRLVVEADSAVAVGIVRKGRSSRPRLRRSCLRLAAITLAERITVEARWVSTSKNMADQPSRGGRAPGPCLPVAEVRPRGSGQGGYAGQRIGEAKKPGPGVPAAALFWSPLLDGNAGEESLRRYATEVRKFCEFVRDADGAPVTDPGELDYWVAYYAHEAYSTGAPAKGAVQKALAGVEFWLPEAKPLRLARRCMRGWDRLQPPRPAAPMPRDLALACAAIVCSLGLVAEGIAILVAFDCWLRIGEVSAMVTGDVVDHRELADSVGRGVSVFMPVAKTGRRQAVLVEDEGVAALLLVWKAAVLRTRGTGARLFPDPPQLREAMQRGLRAFDDGSWDLRGLSFTFHSLRHGGASRWLAAGRDLSAILLRGRWAAESSGRHYLQAGRQLLLGLQLPPHVSTMAWRLLREGLLCLVDPALRDRLRA